MELKRDKTDNGRNGLQSSNRTFMELKLIFLDGDVEREEF